ncbi:MAG: 2-methylfumaryl-CoA isomerase [Hydrogenophaga sp.]|uniref:CoA transferase n=1 Tax=Hydrogenophaga sp. TaxID=1904254 RepID=UPI0016976DAF|nr:CoA transferase [Hydrogenophaga sp.]NIM43848.1 2-methylfumaryl-CoA isomerase [Hydrogenophaga sp.]NIN28914.1 2-methylfumaryl-CoA isomerase [Hydrogenophaga sp.]NIN33373.1 2-methylfumaryl-CoA isomerase [Hydrogenophaga sp.]NIN58048.1 2-methylfumaryl-CoA isomerase [Hydrogenophaga sp.]NIO54346.1 2-methylfumaryl-CoA isomerase [Hydrogenophaga sp.]
MTQQEGILSGLRVVEAAAFVAAPLGGMTLAQMGADVIRIDALGGGLDYRRWPVTQDNTSLFWCGLNKAKRSVALDLASPEGRELAMAIACAPGEDAGLFLTNFPPRGWLDHEQLKAKRPDLIQLTLMGDRHGGSAVDYTVNARLGLPYMTGPVDGEGAVNHVLPAWDLITGQMVAVGLLAAERHRRRTGQGQHVKLALEDVALAVMQHLGFIAEAQQGQPRERHGNALFGAFGRDFVTQDGERVMVVGLTLKQWRSIVEATGLGAEIDALGARLGVDLSREGERFKARAELAALIGPWIAARPFSDVAQAFDRHGVCWSRYQTIAELANDAECSPANPMFRTVQQPGVGDMLAAGIPLDFGAVPRVPAQAAPRLGEHTEEVLTQLLGIDAAQFGRLHDRGVVRVAEG